MVMARGRRAAGSAGALQGVAFWGSQNHARGSLLGFQHAASFINGESTHVLAHLNNFIKHIIQTFLTTCTFFPAKNRYVSMVLLHD